MEDTQNLNGRHHELKLKITRPKWKHPDPTLDQMIYQMLDLMPDQMLDHNVDQLLDQMLDGTIGQMLPDAWQDV